MCLYIYIYIHNIYMHTYISVLILRCVTIELNKVFPAFLTEKQIIFLLASLVPCMNNVMLQYLSQPQRVKCEPCQRHIFTIGFIRC